MLNCLECLVVELFSCLVVELFICLVIEVWFNFLLTSYNGKAPSVTLVIGVADGYFEVTKVGILILICIVFIQFLNC